VILLISNERDITTDYIVLELQRRKIPYLRLNTERLSTGHIRCRPASKGSTWEIDFAGRVFATSDVSAAYFRRPAVPIVSPSVADAAERQYCEQEWTSILRSLYTAIDDRWLNSPTKIAIAEDKPLQLSVAASVGLRVPETLITNDYDAAMHFIEGGATIGKPLQAALLNRGKDIAERVIFTSRIDNVRGIQPQSIAAAPLILQREISKESDIRVTVVDTNVFAVTIGSQAKAETTVDWRRGSHPDLDHERHELPAQVASMCVSVVKRLGLRFAAVDLVLDPNGLYWFLEANPNGQWAWIENRTKLPISSAIVDALLNIAAGRT